MKESTIRIIEKKPGILVIRGAGSRSVAHAIGEQWGAPASAIVTRDTNDDNEEDADTVHVVTWNTTNK